MPLKKSPALLSAVVLLACTSTAHAYRLLTSAADDLIRSADYILEVSYDPAFKTFTVLDTLAAEGGDAAVAATPYKKGDRIPLDIPSVSDKSMGGWVHQLKPATVILFIKDGKVMASGIRVLTRENRVLIPRQVMGPYEFFPTSEPTADELRSACPRLKNIADEVDKITQIADPDQRLAAAEKWIETNRKDMGHSIIENVFSHDMYRETPLGSGVLDPRPFEILVASKDLPTAWKGVHLWANLTAAVPTTWGIPWGSARLSKSSALASPEGRALIRQTANDANASGLDRAIALSLVCTQHWDGDNRDLPPTDAEKTERLTILADLFADPDARVRRAASRVFYEMHFAPQNPPAQLVSALTAACKTAAPGPDRVWLAASLSTISPDAYAKLSGNPAHVFGSITPDPSSPAGGYTVFATCYKKDAHFAAQPELLITSIATGNAFKQKSFGFMLVQPDGFISPSCILPFTLPDLKPGNYLLTATATIRNDDGTNSPFTSESLRITVPPK